MKCDRCHNPFDVIMKVTMGKPEAEWKDIMDWSLCSNCAGGVLVYILDQVPLDYAAADNVDMG